MIINNISNEAAVPYPSCASMTPLKRKPRMGLILRNLNAGMTTTVVARKVRKSLPTDTSGSASVTFRPGWNRWAADCSSWSKAAAAPVCAARGFR